MTTIILGSQWGDEGKGKLTDILCSQAQICARAAGGHNAGHSIKANGVSYDFHLLPSGLVAKGCINLIGSGVVFHVPSFFKELLDVEKKGITDARERIFVSDRCHINFDLHAAVDGLEEIELGSNAVGTTKRGIGPCYSAKAARSGVRLSELFDEPVFERKLRQMAAGYKKRYGDLLKYDVEEEINRFKEYRPKLATHIVDAVAFMQDAQAKNAKILVEGSQALLLDLDYGTYPYVTSSSTCLGGIVAGLALKRRNIKEVIGVVKAYTTRVGSGAFPTEDLGEVGTSLQKLGGEVGVSTGRTRRCGWLDLVVLQYSCAVNDYDSLNLSKLDVLDTFDTIKIAVAYKDPQTGETLPSFPADPSLLERVEVVYHEMPGWKSKTSETRKWEDLPKAAQDYVEYIEKFVGCKIKWIGTGKDREDMIVR
ncbi:Adenylosuccinate synthase [Gnomoniopsis smithogilvyi]|uniref:Adenylosuccinate synthetase n=1 Tax=Gnomoniopsis smithogilvyi TaxID=1191159 RepID=A0A9W8YKI6_9PEZI|nr:Adenylosuccinate synthase [Gnomoniopsis smithogilvyi]